MSEGSMALWVYMLLLLQIRYLLRSGAVSQKVRAFNISVDMVKLTFSLTNNTQENSLLHTLANIHH